jgi:threonine aldolase
MSNEPNLKQLTNMINAVMGQRVLSEEQLGQIMAGAKRAFDRGGMPLVIEYLMRVTQADVDKEEVTQFAETIRSNPQLGRDILEGKKSINNGRKK